MKSWIIDDVKEDRQLALPIWLTMALWAFLLSGALAHCAIFVWVLRNGF